MTTQAEIERQNAEVRRAVRDEACVYGQSKRLVNPYSALLEEVQWRAGHVQALREQLSAYTDAEQLFYYSEDGVAREVPLLRRYDKERELLDRVCKLAISAGIAERYVQLAELQGATLFRVMGRAFDEMELTAEQRQRFGPALRRALAEENEKQGIGPHPVVEAPKNSPVLNPGTVPEGGPIGGPVTGLR
jgi:hypothetical protein